MKWNDWFSFLDYNFWELGMISMFNWELWGWRLVGWLLWLESPVFWQSLFPNHTLVTHLLPWFIWLGLPSTYLYTSIKNHTQFVPGAVSGVDETFSPRYIQRPQEMLFSHFTRMDLKEVLSVFWTTAPGQHSDNLLSSELCPFPFFTSIHPSTSRD